MVVVVVAAVVVAVLVLVVVVYPFVVCRCCWVGWLTLEKALQSWAREDSI